MADQPTAREALHHIAESYWEMADHSRPAAQADRLLSAYRDQVLTEAAELIQQVQAERCADEFAQHDFVDHNTVLQAEAVTQAAYLLLAARHHPDRRQPATHATGALVTDTQPEPPFRFHATPAQIDAFLRFHFAEDTLLRYQQAIGNRAVVEAAEEIRSESVNPMNSPHFREGMRFGADHVDPLRGGGHWPSGLIEFPAKERNSSHE